MIVNGDYVLFGDSNLLRLRYLSTRRYYTLNLNITGAVVSQNGSIVGDNGMSLLLYKKGVTTRINLQPTNSMGTSEGPLIDNSQILYHETNANFNPRRIVLHDGNEMIFAITPSYHWRNTNIFYLFRGRDYSINSGWISYLDGTGSAANQLWTRDPQGNLLQRTNFEPPPSPDGYYNGYYDVYIEKLADNGELMLIHDDKRYLSKPNGDLTLVGSAELGTSYYKNNTWYITIEQSLFELTTN